MKKRVVGRKENLKEKVRNYGCGGCLAHIGLGKYHICMI